MDSKVDVISSSTVRTGKKYVPTGKKPGPAGVTGKYETKEQLYDAIVAQYKRKVGVRTSAEICGVSMGTIHSYRKRYFESLKKPSVAGIPLLRRKWV